MTFPAGRRPKSSPGWKGSSKGRAAQVVEQDEQVVRVDQRLLGGAGEEIFGMVGQELVKGRGRGDQDGRGWFVPAPGAARLLARAGDRPRVTDQQGSPQPANVDAQLEGVGGHHQLHGTVAQAFLDGTALGGEVAGAVAADLTPVPLSLRERGWG